MLNGVLLLGVFTAIGLLSKTESRKTSKDLCKNRCFCEERENILNINCENKGFTTVSQYQPPPNKICQLFLNGNFLSKLNPNDFVNYINVTSLHLGNNGLQEIKTGAFNGLKYLKRLHLNNNNLEIIKEETFAGLESLEYLQADYNYICAIEPGAFSKLNKLKVLILNDNLLPSLPNNVFRFVLLTHLDLRGNRFKSLPFAGVLEHIGGIMEIQLEENPWNCTCDLVSLKAWLDTISVFVGDIVCETPFRLHGKDVTQLIRQDFCPRKNAVDSNQRIMKPSSDSQYQSTFPTSYPGMTQTKPPRASRPPKMRNRSTTRVTASSNDMHVFGPIMVYQTRSPVPVVCPKLCICTPQKPDSGLSINCQERKIYNISDLHPKPSYPKKLHLTSNYLQTIYSTDFIEYGSLELLHLGNNRIAIIQNGAFRNLTNLRRLYLNGNYIEKLTPFLFAGLHSLQYLYLEYNIIKDIAPQTFNSLHNLQLLFLNNNLLRSLPDDVFGGTMLTRLNLRNNHFSHLPVRGVLDQLSPFIQIDLLENPWDCSCDIVALKNWMEMSSTSVVVNEITCDSPSKQAGRLLRSLRNDEVCPDTNSVMGTRMPKVSTSSLAAYTVSVTTDIMSEMDPEVPLSVLILGLLIVFILSVCFGAGLFVLVLKKRKGVENLPSNPNTFDLNALQVPYGSYNTETNIEKPDSHMYNYIHTPASQICQNPIYLQKENDQLAYYRNLKEMSFSTLDHKKDKRARSAAYTISTVGFNNKEPSGRGDSELLYQNITERDNELPSTGDLKYNFALPKALSMPTYESNRRQLHSQDRLNKHKLPRKSTVQTNNQHHRHPWKHRTVPDYLEVLEKYTTTSHL
ncbi:SLIT and NTRK-like protein 2 [Scleropages formosus]|uniref:SLIT and NTRK like family member 2 n=1 Tax=Scleropages formosus TaxID=113540 RepID=A0A8C9RKA3_SCLFO|nr:SLIT and NTRK-like protein 2 [Scleropages formosus]XP_018602048.2 SLIT and NTRK-like protein 2 [Scleropages formosus]